MRNAVTTGFSVLEPGKDLMTGKERYQIVGRAVSEEEVRSLLTSFSGLQRYWDCIGKAQRAQKLLGRGRVMIGSLLVTSGDLKSEYGYYFNPPYEFHAWLDLGLGVIFDPALPGVIEKGLTTHDAIGPYIIDREPVVLAGKPLDWMKYKAEKELQMEARKNGWQATKSSLG